MSEALRDHEAELRALVERQHSLLEIIREISTPALPVYDHVLLLPLVGQLDAERGQQLTVALLAGVERHRASVVIIDITGVPMIDTAVAGHLLQATVAAKLLGAESVLVGVSPEVAQTLVQLGVDFGTLTTRSNLRRAWPMRSRAGRNGLVVHYSECGGWVLKGGLRPPLKPNTFQITSSNLPGSLLRRFGGRRSASRKVRQVYLNSIALKPSL